MVSLESSFTQFANSFPFPKENRSKLLAIYKQTYSDVMGSSHGVQTKDKNRVNPKRKPKAEEGTGQGTSES